MLKVLLKKQLLELKYSYFKDRITGKIKSNKAIAGYSVLYIVLYCLFGFSIFAITMGLKLSFPDSKDTWEIASIMCFLTLFLSTFINMLIAKGILYDAKDNELLLSLPIPDKYIVVSRMLNVFINAVIYTSILWIPMIIHSLIYLGFSFLLIIYGIITLILLSLVVTALSCLFGYLIALLTKKVKKKNLVTTALTLVLLGLYYYVYFNANKFLNALIQYKEEFIRFLETKGFLLSSIGKAVTGNTVFLLISIGMYLLICVVALSLIIINYRKQLITTPSFSKKEFKGNYSKQSSITNTLINRELKLFFSNSTYTLNCGLGFVVLIAASIALIIFKGKIDSFLAIINTIPILKDALPFMVLFSILLIVGMDALSVPAVSLEGKHYWLIRSLPVSTYDVLNSKRNLQFRMHVIPSVILAVICTFVFNINDILQVLLVVAVIVGVTFITYADLFLGIMGANIKWTDPTSVIKGSGNVFIALFGDMILFPAVCVLYMFVLSNYISATLFIIIIIIFFAAMSIILDRWVRTKGVKLFENLG